MRFVALPSPNGAETWVNPDRVLYVAEAETEDATRIEGVSIIVFDTGHSAHWVRVALSPEDCCSALAGRNEPRRPLAMTSG